MKADYGYFTRAGNGKTPIAVDGDAVDVFIGDKHDSDLVVAIDQYYQDKYDETKFVICVESQKEGEALYLSNYAKGWKLGPTSTCTIPQLREWLKNGKHKKPFKSQLLKAANTMTESIPHTPVKDMNLTPWTDNLVNGGGERQPLPGVTEIPNAHQILRDNPYLRNLLESVPEPEVNLPKEVPAQVPAIAKQASAAEAQAYAKYVDTAPKMTAARAILPLLIGQTAAGGFIGNSIQKNADPDSDSSKGAIIGSLLGALVGGGTGAFAHFNKKDIGDTLNAREEEEDLLSPE